MADSLKVACLLGEGFEDSEFRKPYDALRSAGYVVDIIGKELGKEVKGKQGKDKVKIELPITDVKPEDYAMLFIPGGHSPDTLRADKRFVQFVKDFDALHRPIAAVCHGPQLLMAAGLVGRGRTLTGWTTVQEDLKYTGATVKDEPLVRDANWITSRKPEDLDVFTSAMLEALKYVGSEMGVMRGAGEGVQPSATRPS